MSPGIQDQPGQHSENPSINQSLLAEDSVLFCSVFLHSVLTSLFHPRNDLAQILTLHYAEPQSHTIHYGAHVASQHPSAYHKILGTFTLGYKEDGSVLEKVGVKSGTPTTYRHIELYMSFIKGHHGGVEAYRVHDNGPWIQEKNGEGESKQADDHRQEHGELPV